MSQRLPVHGVPIHQRAETRARVLKKVSPFPRLEAEMNRGEAQMRGDGHIVGRICTNANAPLREEKGVALGSAKFSNCF